MYNHYHQYHRTQQHPLQPLFRQHQCCFYFSPSPLQIQSSSPSSSSQSFFRNMFGGDNNNPMPPIFLEENRFQYNANSLPQLQLFGDVGCSVGPLHYVGNEPVTIIDRPVKRSRDTEPTSGQQKHHRLLLNDNFHQEEARQPGSVLNSNPVSTGLRLSYEEDEHNSSVSSVCEKKAVAMPVIWSLVDNLKVEIDRHNEEFDRYIRLQEENIVKGVREFKQRDTYAFLSAIEKGIGSKLHEKELEIENMNSKNKELVERIKQASMEVQSWQYRAKYNESVVSVLKNNLKQVKAQGNLHGKEGCGDSDVDDAASHTNGNHPSNVDGPGNSINMNRIICRACKVQEVSILILPCRHLCLCKYCEGFIEVCPVCKVMKAASVQVYLA